MRTFILFFALQFTLYLLVTVNFRAIAQARYGWTILTDTLISAAQFWIIRKVGTSADNSIAWFGFVVGGAAGSTVGIWLSKRVFGKKTLEDGGQSNHVESATGQPTISSWEKWSTVATLGQFIIVAVSLGFIWWQLQQQTAQLDQQLKLSRAANTQALVDLITPINLRLTDYEMAELWVMGDDGIKKIANAKSRKVKQEQYEDLLASHLIFYENTYSQFCHRLLEPEIYEGWDKDLASFLRERKLEAHWNQWRNLYHDDFRNHVDEIIEFQKSYPQALLPPNPKKTCHPEGT
jgi:hypothetical protein